MTDQEKLYNIRKYFLEKRAKQESHHTEFHCKIWEIEDLLGIELKSWNRTAIAKLKKRLS